jgi:hypothetical protein
MKISLGCIAFLTFADSALGLLVLTTANQHPVLLLNLSMAISATEEAASRAGTFQQAVAPPLKLFKDELLDEMQQCLQKLERSVRERPGALSLLEVEEFDFSTQRILQEMKLNEHNQPKPVPAIPDGVPAPRQAAVAVATPPQQPQGQGQLQPQVPSSSNQQHVTDTSQDKGPAYDGSGGMGLSKGTVISMSFLAWTKCHRKNTKWHCKQKSVSDQQKKRQETGGYGNIMVKDYLNNLGKGSMATGMVKKKSWDPKTVE